MELFRSLRRSFLEFQRWGNGVESLALHLCSQVPGALAEALSVMQHVELQNPFGPGFCKVTPPVNTYFEGFVRCNDCAEMSICPVTK